MLIPSPYVRHLRNDVHRFPARWVERDDMSGGQVWMGNKRWGEGDSKGDLRSNWPLIKVFYLRCFCSLPDM